jgi:hypothetical protein
MSLCGNILFYCSVIAVFFLKNRFDRAEILLLQIMAVLRAASSTVNKLREWKYPPINSLICDYDEDVLCSPPPPSGPPPSSRRQAYPASPSHRENPARPRKLSNSNFRFTCLHFASIGRRL